MRFAPLLPLALGLAGCATDPSDGDVTGPYTGQTHRYVVDRIDVPMNTTMAREAADDLDGNTTKDNQLAMVISTLSSQGDITTHGADMIASGAIASTVEIVANDLTNDPSVSVLYRGADAEQAVAAGGRFEGGAFVSNRTATTRVPGSTILHMPAFIDAAPAELPLENVEIDLTPDGAGGYDGFVRGTMTYDDALTATFDGATQMIAAHPQDHFVFLYLIDQPPHDFQITRDELTKNSLVQALLYPDVTLGGHKLLSFGIRVHLAPCADGRCVSSPPADTCNDRIVDGDETDIDCGGSCGVCTGPAHCAAPSDCESASCIAGQCAAPACTDGVRNAFETDVDCGSNCGPCATGKRCYTDHDCPTGHTCGLPCQPGQTCIDSFDTCR